MMKLLRTTFFLAIFFNIYNVFASDAVANSGHIKYCMVSKKVINDYEPENFQPSNNLLRKAGQQDMFCGEKVVVHGKVLDQNCMPVADAKIYLWQANCKGKYPYKPLRNAAKKTLVDINSELTFAGNGIATTDNKGEFVFITTYPGSVEGAAPALNVRVEHYSLGSLQTQLTLHGKNVTNPENRPDLQYLFDAVKENGTSIYDFELVMPNVRGNSYKEE